MQVLRDHRDEAEQRTFQFLDAIPASVFVMEAEQELKQTLAALSRSNKELEQFSSTSAVATNTRAAA